MEWYGLTDRRPGSLILTTPVPREWSLLAATKKAEDFAAVPDQWRANVETRLPRYAFPERVRGRPITIHRSKYYAPGVQVREPRARLSGVGRVFVDMLLDPHLCGGMQHVIDVWKEHAVTYREEIIAAVDQCPNKLLKVRAGYILEELVSIHDQRIRAWAQHSQRGGSQKLDPSKPYRPVWSEAWKISINV
jgi:predicted transcriptional regulator of viral defense system